MAKSELNQKGKIADLPGSLPRVKIADDVDHASFAKSMVEKFNSLAVEDVAENALWRDQFALTGCLRTLYGAYSIFEAWNDLLEDHRQYDFKVIPGTSRINRAGPDVAWVEARFTFKTTHSRPSTCSGTLRIIPGEGNEWKIWGFTTILESIDGLPSVDELEPVESPTSDAAANGASHDEPSDGIYDCAIVGAGTAGLSLAGRLKALNVSSVTFERNPEVGDNWVLRYRSLRLHTPRSYGQMPFAPIWGPEYPDLLPIKDLAEGMKKYVRLHGLDVRVSTVVEHADWNSENQTWSISVRHNAQLEVITARHLVFATGPGTTAPSMPDLPGREAFNGVVMHSMEYDNCDAWSGKKGVVVGSANTGHDIAEDMLDAGLSPVTMVQRGYTPVVSAAALKNTFKLIYNDGVPTEVSDRIMWASPAVLTRLTRLETQKSPPPEILEWWAGLEKVNFKLNREFDIIKALFERRGGHYVDIGATDKIIKGLIKMKSDSPLVGFTATGLKFANGSTLDADVVIFATGYRGNMRIDASDIVGKEIGDQLDDWGGINPEGELRGAFTPIGHPRLWFHGADIAQGRYFSRFVALQIRCELDGKPLKPYLKTFGLEKVREGEAKF